LYANLQPEGDYWLDFPREVFNHKGKIRAHNAAFERLMFWYVLGIDFELEQFYCTATQARANCAPGSLEDAGRFAGASMRKNFRGIQLIRAFSLPRADGTLNEDPALMAEMVAYCEQDVRAMRDISTSMRQLSDEELHDYHVNERINDRGILIDLPLAQAATKYAKVELAEVQGILAEVTEGEVLKARSPKLKTWVLERVGPEAIKLMTVYEDDVKRFSLAKEIRENILDLADENPEEVPNEVADAIQCASDLWSSSVAKFNRMAQLADEEDNRVRGAFVFNGASATGRVASFGIQFQNMARNTAKDPDAVRDAMIHCRDLTPMYGSCVTKVLKGMIRPALIPAEGNIFVVADWSSIEGRVNPWMAQSEYGEQKLDLYRQGLDPYIVNASHLYQTPYEDINKAQRQGGKVMELALSYGGTIKSFSHFAKVYHVVLHVDEVNRAIKTWRRNNPWMKQRGDSLEHAAKLAMRQPNKDIQSDRVTYLFDGQHLWYALPSGRILVYPFAKVEGGSITYARSSRKPKADATIWPRGRLWFGELLNNTTQAPANCLLRYALRELDKIRHVAVAHIHDEIVCECKEEDVEVVIADMTRVMTTPPEWATGLPLEIDIKTMKRYSK
jgi:DNA polymerase